MEMQFVTFSDEFASLSEAVESGDGAALMVLGVFFELGNTDHPELEAMIQLMCVGTPFLLGGGGGGASGRAGIVCPSPTQ